MYVTLIVMVMAVSGHYPITQVTHIGIDHSYIRAKLHCEKLAENIRAMDTTKKIVTACVSTNVTDVK